MPEDEHPGIPPTGRYLDINFVAVIRVVLFRVGLYRCQGEGEGPRPFASIQFVLPLRFVLPC